MKKEQEIVLRKKTKIIFSLLMITCVMGILNWQKSTVFATTNDEVKMVYTDYSSNVELFSIELEGNVEPVQLRVQEDEPKVEKNNLTEGIEQGINNKVASRGSYIRETEEQPTDYEQVITVSSTAYCLCQKCCGKSPNSPGYGHTASGFIIKPGAGMHVIAVDPSIIPLGSQVYVEGYGYAIAADTGGAIKGYKIDVYKDTHTQALQWGRRTVKVYLLKEEEF